MRSDYRLGFTTLDYETAIDALPIRGDVPDWLRGTLVRTGPAKFEVGARAYNHWFDGLAMLHAFAFGGGRVGYANRFLRSRSFVEAEREGRIARSEFATDPCRTLFGRVMATFNPDPTDNANVSVQALAGHAVALTETRLPIRFDVETLETLGALNEPPGDDVPGVVSIAHPHYDAARGLHYSYLLDFGRRSTYRLFSIDAATGRRALVAELPADEPAYMHSFGMTERYLVLTEFPLVVNPLRLLAGGLRGVPFIRNYRWEPERGLRVRVVEKDSGRLVREARGDALFAFHHVNAFEADSALVLDLVAYADASIIDQLYLARLRSGAAVTAAGRLARLRVDLEAGTVRQEPLPAAVSEIRLGLPRIDYARCAGRPHRIFYAAGYAPESRAGFIDALVKVDLAAGAVDIWRDEGCYPGEGVYVPAPDAEREDDGVVLSVVLDAAAGRSCLLVLDAATWTERARAEVPHHIPFGFHGNYFGSGTGRGVEEGRKGGTKEGEG